MATLFCKDQNNWIEFYFIARLIIANALFPRLPGRVQTTRWLSPKQPKSKADGYSLHWRIQMAPEYQQSTPRWRKWDVVRFNYDRFIQCAPAEVCLIPLNGRDAPIRKEQRCISLLWYLVQVPTYRYPVPEYRVGPEYLVFTHSFMSHFPILRW